MTIQVDERQLDEIVRRILVTMNDRRVPQGEGPKGIFNTVDEAFTAVEWSQRRFNRISIAKRKAFIAAMRETILANSQQLAQMAVEETKLGRVADKVIKTVLAADLLVHDHQIELPVIRRGQRLRQLREHLLLEDKTQVLNVPQVLADFWWDPMTIIFDLDGGILSILWKRNP